MSMISFDVGSKPELSPEQLEERMNQSGGKYINEPGTYSVKIISAAFDEKRMPSDQDWVQLILELEDGSGATIKHYQSVPTTAKNSFLFGAKKSVFPLKSLQALLRGLGEVFDYENGMQQIARVFGKPETLIGKPLSIRVGYEGAHIKYSGKNANDEAQYEIVDKDHKTRLIDAVFSTRDAAKNAAQENGIDSRKLGFARVLEFFAGERTEQKPTTTALPF